MLASQLDDCQMVMQANMQKIAAAAGTGKLKEGSLHDKTH
jgi:hypothetical protein